MKDNNWNNVELRDNRYNQIVHMVSAANGAEDFYSTEVRLKKKSLEYLAKFSGGLGSRMPFGGRGASQGARLQGGGRLGRPSLLRRHRQLFRL